MHPGRPALSVLCQMLWACEKELYTGLLRIGRSHGIALCMHLLTTRENVSLCMHLLTTRENVSEDGLIA